MSEKITIENVNCPGKEYRVDRQKYSAMREVLLKVIPKDFGITQEEIRLAILPHLPQEIWPGGEKSMWWAKTVQLDLEAKGLIKRTSKRPLRWYRAL